MGWARRRRAGHARRRRWTTGAVTALLALHVAIVIDTERVMGRPEFFPFASFSLFSRVPNVVNDFSVRVRSIDGNCVGDDVWFEWSPTIFLHASDHHAIVAVHRLGDLIDHAGVDDPGVARMRRWLEQNWLRRRSSSSRGVMEYEIVSRRYDPLARWRDGTFLQVRHVASFSTTQPSTSPAGAKS